MSEQKQKYVYVVHPRKPVYDAPYYVVAHDFGEAERLTLEQENSGDLDCQGIREIQKLCPYYPGEKPNTFVGF